MAFSNSYTLNLDLKKTISNKIPTFVADDTAILYVKVTDDGQPIDLSTATRYTVSLQRPDGLVVTGTGVYENGLLKYQLGHNEMAIQGSLSVIVQFYQNGTRISVKPFTIKIIGDLVEDVASSSQLPLLQQLVADGDYAVAQGNYAKSQADNLVNKGDYSSTVAYKANNIVTYSGVSYMCLIDAPIGTLPTDATYFSIIAPQARFNSQSWTATEGQTVFTITNGSYVINSNNIEVSVGGVPQQTGVGFTETNSTSFTLAEGVVAGTVIISRWVEGAFTISKTHNLSHQLGGQDELDVTKLKNYQEQISSPINVLYGVNNYRTDYTYTGNKMATETVSDLNGNEIGKTTYTYVNGNLDTSVLVMNGQTITSKYTYDSNGNILSIVNTKS
jgi:hypothetical protein